jgi:hypothetical protein
METDFCNPMSCKRANAEVVICELITPGSIKHGKFRKTNVIADSYSYAPHICINNCGTIPSSENIRLLECDLPWNINVKQMHLNTMMSKPTFRKTCHSWFNCEVK